MVARQTHPSDERLLLFSDQELPIREAAVVREHVAQCDTCRARLTGIENALNDFADLHEQEIRAQSFHSTSSRDLLRAHLSEARVETGRSHRPPSQATVMRQLAGACLALLIVLGGTWAVRFAGRQPNPDLNRAEVIALPRRALTPGAVRPVQLAELCNTQDLDNDPPVTPTLEQAVLQEYGIAASAEKNYALDYLITPELGGSNSIQNLWPQPYSSTWNARVKDQLEDHLHVLVCQGKIQLTTAQNDIASDWIAAYKRYFNTDHPEPGSFSTTNDRSHDLLPVRQQLRASLLRVEYSHYEARDVPGPSEDIR
jgi:hypothetical protein